MTHDGDLSEPTNPVEAHDAGALPVAERESAPLPIPSNERESAPLPSDEQPILFDDSQLTTQSTSVDTSLPTEPPTAQVDAAVPPLIETFDSSELRETLPVDTAPLEEAPDAADLPAHELRAVIESLLFVATRPLSTARLCGCLPGCHPGYLEGFLRGLSARFDHEQRGWELRFIANGWQILTRRAYHAWVRQLERKELPTKLSRSALETLSIVAYKQPIARGAIEDIRGVQCGPVLRQLMDLKMVHVIGRDDHTLGRPLLYGTTDAFLHRFGLGRIEDLPRSHEFGA